MTLDVDDTLVFHHPNLTWKLRDYSEAKSQAPEEVNSPLALSLHYHCYRDHHTFLALLSCQILPQRNFFFTMYTSNSASFTNTGPNAHAGMCHFPEAQPAARDRGA
jgi:hypothetical protein